MARCSSFSHRATTQLPTLRLIRQSTAAGAPRVQRAVVSVGIHHDGDRSLTRRLSGIIHLAPALAPGARLPGGIPSSVLCPFLSAVLSSSSLAHELERGHGGQGVGRTRQLPRADPGRPLLALAATHRHLGHRRHDRADRHRHAAGGPPLAAAEGLHPLPHLLFHAAGALDRRHRHRLELDLQPHLRHPQRVARRRRVGGHLARLARRSRRRALRGARRRRSGPRLASSSSSSWPACKTSARISWRRRRSMGRMPGSVSGM